MTIFLKKNRASPRQRGFSLIEILIVIFIIGLMSALVALSIGDSNEETPLKKETNLLRTEFEFAAEQSVLDSEVVGLIVEKKVADRQSVRDSNAPWCYHWVRKLSGEDPINSPWVALPKDTLEDHCLPEMMQWDIVIDGRQWGYDPNLEKQDPVLVFAPSGEATPVEMAFYEAGVARNARDKNIERIEVDMLGNITPAFNDDDENTDDEKVTSSKTKVRKK